MAEYPDGSTTGAQKALEEAVRTGFTLLKWALIIGLVGLAVSGVFIVEQNESAMVLRFGRIVGTKADRILKPGLHFAFPYPVDEVVKLPSKMTQTLQNNNFWYGETDMEAAAGRKMPPAKTMRTGVDGYLITGDMNLAHTRWLLSYIVTNPEDLVFTYADLSHTIQDILDNTIVSIAGKYTVDDILRSKREEFKNEVQGVLVHGIRSQAINVDIQGLDLIQISAPLQVVGAFNAVLEAEQARDQAIAAARSYADTTSYEAEAERTAILTEAEAYKAGFIDDINAEKDYFSQIKDQFESNPDVVRNTIYLGTIGRVLEQANTRFLMPERGADREVRLLLNKGPKKK